MSEEPTRQERAKRFAVLEERMNTMDAQKETSQERLNATLERFRTDIANRETRLILAMIVIVGVGLTIFGLLTAPSF